MSARHPDPPGRFLREELLHVIRHGSTQLPADCTSASCGGILAAERIHLRKTQVRNSPRISKVSRLMFERYTEKARRTIFFARYEASQYGSRSIESEHLLLGLLREDQSVAKKFLRERGGDQAIREEFYRSSSEKVDTNARDIVSVSQLVEAWSEGNAGDLANMFAADGQFVDAQGDLWIGPPRIKAAASLIFSAPGWVACKGRIEDVQFVGAHAAMATLVWERDANSEKHNPACVRMTVILMQKPEGWTIARVQATA